MTLFSKIRKVLETEDACIISKEGVSLYAVITWKKYETLLKKLEKADGLQKIFEEEEKDGAYNIDINKIPV